MGNGEWKVNKIKDSVDCFIFEVERSEKTNPAGKVGDYIKIKSKDWALAIIHTADNKYVLTNQYRHGIDTNVTEFPCGIIEDGETPMEAAIRESEEEVGLDKSKISSIKKIYSQRTNPGFMNNTMHAFYIQSEQDSSDFMEKNQHLDENEFIKIFTLSEANVDEVMEEKDTSVMMSFAWKMK